MSGWGCGHEQAGQCGRVTGRACDPGMKGCVLAGRFRFTNPEKNRKPQSRPNSSEDSPADAGGTKTTRNDEP